MAKSDTLLGLATILFVCFSLVAGEEEVEDPNPETPPSLYRCVTKVRERLRELDVSYGTERVELR